MEERAVYEVARHHVLRCEHPLCLALESVELALALGF